MEAEFFARRCLEHLGGAPWRLVGDEAAALVRPLLACGVDVRCHVGGAEVAAIGAARFPGRFTRGAARELGPRGAAPFNLLALGALDDLPADAVRSTLDAFRDAEPLGLVLVAATAARPDLGIVEGRSRAWWEERCLEAGFRRHPRTLQLRSPRAAGAGRDGAVLLLEPVPRPALRDYPLSRLAESRSLHMDMTRESGSRADAHMARYDWARRFVAPGDRVVDAACGLGYGAWSLLRQTEAAHVAGIDGSAFAIGYARAAFADERLDFVLGDLPGALDGLPDASVDCVVSFETLEHVPDPAALLAGFARVLRPAGRVVVSVPHDWTDETGRDPNPHHLDVYDWGKLRALLSSRFLLDRAAAQTADRAKVDGRWTRQGPGLKPFDPGSPSPAHPAEWLLATGVKPFHPAPSAPFPHRYVANGEPVRINPIDYPAMLDNPWLSRGLLNAGLRLAAPATLRGICDEVAAAGGAKDEAAALTIAGYRLAEAEDASREALVGWAARLEAWLAANGGSDDVQVLRWRMSLTFLRGVLAEAVGDLGEAERAFARCAAIDPAPFGPMLFTKVVEANHKLGWIRYGRGSPAGAREAWAAGVEAARRALALRRDAGAEPSAARLDFVLSEYAALCETGNRCAIALERLEARPDRRDLLPVLHRPRERNRDLQARVDLLAAELAAAKAAAVAAASRAAEPGALPFPFAADGWRREPDGEASVAIRHGNKHCRATPGGFSLQANKPGRPAACFVATGLDGTGRTTLRGELLANPRSPAVVVTASAAALGGGARAEEVHRLQAGARASVALALPEGAAPLEVRVSIVLGEGVAAVSSAGVQVRRLRLA